MTRILLARHGETIWHHENRYAGRSDVSMTETGYRQAERLAAWASQTKLDGLWVSPLSRARETANPVERATGMVATVDARLREIDFGEGDGLTLAEMKQRFGERLALFLQDPVSHYLPGGESPLDAADRAVSCLREISALHPDGQVLVIAHNTLYRLVLCRLLEMPMSHYRKAFAPVRNDALMEIALDQTEAMLVRFNVPVQSA